MKNIIYIHGLNCSSKIFSYLHQNLPEHNSQFIEYNSHASIDESLQEINSKIENTINPSWIVGHSLGGIMGYLLLTRKLINVQGLISISTPFGGSYMATGLRWVVKDMPILKDLSPFSPIIREISLQKKHIKQPIISIISTAGNLPFMGAHNDGVVSLQSQRATPAKTIVHINSNHFETVQDNQTVSTIEKFVFNK